MGDLRRKPLRDLRKTEEGQGISDKSLGGTE